MQGIIYKITNKINGKIYIGQTRYSLAQRWSSHLGAKKGCPILKKAVKKYGKGNFKIEIVIKSNHISKEDLDLKENFCIRIFNSLAPFGYNLRLGGSNSNHSEQTKQKISKSIKGRIPWNKGLSAKNDTRVAKINESLKGRRLSKEHKENISNSKSGERHYNFGKSLSEETKKKISDGNKRRFLG